ncbi:unnamed protein product [Linum trigynum]|uniref:CCHC-type domain-containing protein n=1 Tax=Linum trigynum TaxID=586398 RepID=A0AAV2GRX6_9ROSI
MDLNNDTFLVTFSNEQDYLTALIGGPWVILDHYLVVHQWSPSFRTGQKPYRSVVAWIQLPELPVHFYNREVLFAIGNLIGRTVKLDYHTEHRQRGKFARIAVELDMSKPVPSRIHLDGFWQAVRYENLPLICFECGCVGHSDDSCPSRKPHSDMEIVMAQTSDRRTAPDDSTPEPPSGYGPWMQVTRKSRKQSGKVTLSGEQNQKNRHNDQSEAGRQSSKTISKGNSQNQTVTSLRDGNGKESAKTEQPQGPSTSQKGKAIKESDTLKTSHKNNVNQVWRPIGSSEASSSKDGRDIVKPMEKPNATKNADRSTSVPSGPITQILGPNNTKIQENSPPHGKTKGLSLKSNKKAVTVPTNAKRELKKELNRNVKNAAFPITVQAIEAFFAKNPSLAALANKQGTEGGDDLMEEQIVEREAAENRELIVGQQPTDSSTTLAD